MLTPEANTLCSTLSHYELLYLIFHPSNDSNEFNWFNPLVNQICQINLPLTSTRGQSKFLNDTVQKNINIKQQQFFGKNQ